MNNKITRKKFLKKASILTLGFAGLSNYLLSKSLNQLNINSLQLVKDSNKILERKMINVCFRASPNTWEKMPDFDCPIHKKRIKECLRAQPNIMTVILHAHQVEACGLPRVDILGTNAQVE